MATTQDITMNRYFKEAFNQAMLREAWAKLTGYSTKLNDLHAIDNSRIVNTYSEPGIQTLKIDQIHGSEGRVVDFDRNFNPRQSHTRERWQGIAQLVSNGYTLPPIDLIRIGEHYFVRDGHHRMSVARSLGQVYIDANVTVWRVEGALPWDQAEPHGDLLQRIIVSAKAFIGQANQTITSLFRPTHPSTQFNIQMACVD